MITFYKMPGCGHCDVAEKELQNDISSGKVIVKSFRDAPKDVTGFPHFTAGDKSVSGWVGRDKLYEKLGIEPYEEDKSSNEDKMSSTIIYIMVGILILSILVTLGYYMYKLKKTQNIPQHFDLQKI